MGDNIIASNNPWSITDQEALKRIAQLVIGKDPEGAMPSVDDDLIWPSILERSLDFERPVRNGLNMLNEHLNSQNLSKATDLSDDALAGLMESRKELRSLLRAMMQIVAKCFYQDHRVLNQLGFEARPPFPAGHEVEDGDWDLLEPVRSRPPLFR